MNYYQFHIGDYASHTSHLDPIEDLAYRRMLDLYYRTQQPLPSDVQRIARLIRLPDNAATVRDILNEFFTPCDAGWSNSRADREIEAFQRMQDGGKKGAAKRWAKGSDSHPIATPSPPQFNPNANHEPITNNQEPVNNSVPNGTGDKSPLTPSEIIYSYGLTLLTNAGTPDKQARSFLGGLVKAHGADAVVDKLRACIREKPIQPIEWLAAALPPKGIKSKQQSLEERNRAIADAWQPPEM